jgi:hypothetical protein
MENWNQLKEMVRNFSIHHNLELSENYHETDSWNLRFGCSKNSMGLIQILFGFTDRGQPAVRAVLTTYDFEAGFVKEKYFKFNYPELFDESKYLEGLKKTALEMVRLEYGEFDDKRKLKIHSNPNRLEMDSPRIEGLKEALNNLPIPWFEGQD